MALHSVVCLKQVPDTTQVHMDPQTGTLQREGVPSIINPFDVHALEAALVVRDLYGGKVTVLSMGPPQAMEALKKSLSMGASEAILLTDRAFAGADTWATSYTLATAIRQIDHENPVDLIFCGKQTIDGDTAQVGPGIATNLGLSQLTYVVNIQKVDLEKKEIWVERKLEEGREIVKAKLPALLTILKEANTPRYASLKALLRAARQSITVWDKNALPVDPERIGLKGSPTTVSKISAPPQRPPGEILAHPEGVSQTIGLLLDKLLQDKVIEPEERR